MTLSGISYATVAQMLDQGSGALPTSGTDEYTEFVTRLYEFGVRASQVCDELKKFTFAPLIHTEYIDALGDKVHAFDIDLPRPMMSLTSVTLADGTALSVGTDVRGWPRSGCPILELRTLDTSVSMRQTSGTLDNDIAVTGVWGWHSDYANAWIDSGDAVKTDALDTTTTTVKVTAADGVGGDGLSPRFSPGNMIQIDSEWMAVTAVDTSEDPDELTVVRAIRGSTAATHAADTTISVFQPEPAITRTLMLWAQFAYARRGQSSRVAWDTVQTGPNNYDIPPKAMAILDTFQFLAIGSA